jgi:hypothetical protein
MEKPEWLWMLNTEQTGKFGIVPENGVRVQRKMAGVQREVMFQKK